MSNEVIMGKNNHCRVVQNRWKLSIDAHQQLTTDDDMQLVEYKKHL